MLPPSLAPKPQMYGGFLEMSPLLSSSSSKSRITRVFQDPTGENVSLITSVTEYGGKVYLGNLHETYIGVYDLGPKPQMYGGFLEMSPLLSSSSSKSRITRVFQDPTGE